MDGSVDVNKMYPAKYSEDFFSGKILKSFPLKAKISKKGQML
jgi:hypothetical protein